MSTAPDDAARLEQYLIEQGAEPEELREAAETGTLGPLALELALRRPGPRMSFTEAAAEAGLEPAGVARLWRALGVPDPLLSSPKLTPAQIDTLRILGEMARLLGEETALQLARIIGGAVAQIAEAVVDTFRVKVEIPRRDAGEPDAEVVEDYARVASVFVPALAELITDALRTHMVAVARSSWGLDEDRATVTRELTVGFVDLVDFTPSARRASPTDLATIIGRFESLIGELVPSFEGRVVKLIGDEAMFIVRDPDRACELALEMIHALDADPQLPAVRVALATGPVVSHHGDYYGDIVNLAARLVKIAEPGEPLVSESVATGGRSDRFRFELAQVPSLKGYDDSVAAYRLKPPPL